MADDTDLEALAQRYLDLWQDQISALAADPDFAANLQRMMQGFGPGGFGAAGFGGATVPPGLWPAMAGFGGNAQGDEEDGSGQARAAAPGDGAPGTATAGPSPGPSGPDLDELARRLSALEERVAALEAAAGGPSKRPRRKPSRG